MKKKIVDDSMDGKIKIEFLSNKKTMRIELDKTGCEFLIETLKDLLTGDGYPFIDYDPGTGYDCGILRKDSLGLMIEIIEKDENKK